MDTADNVKLLSSALTLCPCLTRGRSLWLYGLRVGIKANHKSETQEFFKLMDCFQPGKHYPQKSKKKKLTGYKSKRHVKEIECVLFFVV